MAQLQSRNPSYSRRFSRSTRLGKDFMHKPTSRPTHPYPPLPKESDPSPQPADTFAYLHLLGILLFLTKSRPDIMAAVSFAGT